MKKCSETLLRYWETLTYSLELIGFYMTTSSYFNGLSEKIKTFVCMCVFSYQWFLEKLISDVTLFLPRLLTRKLS